MRKRLIKAPPNPLVPQLPRSGNLRIGLALGGGGARGLAHILMLEALEEMGVIPTIIAGTSIGAVYGAAAAVGLKPSFIRAHTEEILSQRFDLVRGLLSVRADPVQKLFNLLPLRAALLNSEALLELILPAGIPKKFEDLSTQFVAIATDFFAQEAAVFSAGQLRPAIAASMALPAIFQPVVIEGRTFVDGGLVNPLPFDLIGAMADITIAVDVSGAGRNSSMSGVPSAIENLFASSQILQRSIVREKLRYMQPDVYIDVDVDKFHVLEFHRYKEILAAAAPAKATLKRQLDKVLTSATLSESDAVSGSGAMPDRPGFRGNKWLRGKKH